MRKSFFLLLLAIGLASCNNDDLVDAKERLQNDAASFKISPNEAKVELGNFVNQLNATNKRMRSTNALKMAEVLPIRNRAQTRSVSQDNLENRNSDIDTLMYAINFANGQGFALVAADRRTTPILAIIDEGSFCVDSLKEDKDEGFLTFLDNAIEMEIQDIKNYGESLQTRSLANNGYVISAIHNPILHTKWSQQSVYGKYCPNNIAGCVIIATAQILSHYKTIDHVNWAHNGITGSSDLHWNKIISDCDNNNGTLISSSVATSADEVAHLVRYLGIALGADYNKNSTGTKSSKAIEWFNKYGRLKASSLKGYNEKAILSAIETGNPVFGRGNSGKKKVLGIRVGWKGGHAWVYDGSLVASKDGKTNNFVHCNWGWGGYKNGFYVSKAFNTNVGAAIYDPYDSQIGSSPNFKYNLEYSIITK